MKLNLKKNQQYTLLIAATILFIGLFYWSIQKSKREITETINQTLKEALYNEYRQHLLSDVYIPSKKEKSSRLT